jgi:hypothetical protein
MALNHDTQENTDARSEAELAALTGRAAQAAADCAGGLPGLLPVAAAEVYPW